MLTKCFIFYIYRIDHISGLVSLKSLDLSRTGATNQNLSNFRSLINLTTLILSLTEVLNKSHTRGGDILMGVKYFVSINKFQSTLLFYDLPKKKCFLLDHRRRTTLLYLFA